MALFRIFVLLIALFASTSAFSDTEQKQLSLSCAEAIEQCSSDKTNTFEALLTFELTPAISHQSISKTQRKSLDFAQPSRINLLNNKQQQSPEYVLAYELLTSQFDVFENRESTLAQSPIPWFMNYSESSSRLSGWKESNTLYASKVTYHLI